MAQMKIYISDSTDKQLRKEAMLRFGYGRGAISKAVEEAATQWLKKESIIKSVMEKLIARGSEDNNVIAIILFGSYARKDPDFNDIDVGFLVKDRNKFSVLNYMNLLEDTEASIIQISALNDFPAWKQSRLIGEGELLHVNDRDDLYDYTANLIRDFSDNAHVAEVLLK